eukprot:TRINITY_DN16434_c0_g1_i2.p1 TRINITY_DN16434_c0_g1~~TRINITY_DN16434_c0_g1_i2.p1  ORF type:complete len:428 (+),score=56.12 TRINITY_DN16434_c0_g1_i2:39-1286(+)
MAEGVPWGNAMQYSPHPPQQPPPPPHGWHGQLPMGSVQRVQPASASTQINSALPLSDAILNIPPGDVAKLAAQGFTKLGDVNDLTNADETEFQLAAGLVAYLHRTLQGISIANTPATPSPIPTGPRIDPGVLLVDALQQFEYFDNVPLREVKRLKSIGLVSIGDVVRHTTQAVVPANDKLLHDIVLTLRHAGVLPNAQPALPPQPVQLLPGPAFEILNQTGDEYRGVSQQWMVGGCTEYLRVVVKIQPAPLFAANFERYCQELIRQNVVPFGQHGGPGNEQRRFHGTRYACSFGLNSLTPCSNPACSVCRIMTEGFQIRFVGGHTDAGWYGQGHYFSSKSSIAIKYADVNQGNGIRAVFLCRVLVGNGYKVTSVQTQGAAPPAGYHSILAEIDGADELVVFNDAAILPLYLLLFA